MTAEARQFKTQILVIWKIYIFCSNIPRRVPSGTPRLFAQTASLPRKGLSHLLLLEGRSHFQGVFFFFWGVVLFFVRGFFCSSCMRISCSATNSILKSFLGWVFVPFWGRTIRVLIKNSSSKGFWQPFVGVEFLAVDGWNGSQVGGWF